VARDDHHAIMIRDDDVAGKHRDAAAADRSPVSAAIMRAKQRCGKRRAEDRQRQIAQLRTVDVAETTEPTSPAAAITST
jgi:hypothetical protein